MNPINKRAAVKKSLIRRQLLYCYPIKKSFKFLYINLFYQKIKYISVRQIPMQTSKSPKDRLR